MDREHKRDRLGFVFYLLLRHLRYTRSSRCSWFIKLSDSSCYYKGRVVRIRPFREMGFVFSLKSFLVVFIITLLHLISIFIFSLMI